MGLCRNVLRHSLHVSLQVAVFCRQVSCFLVRDVSADTRGPSSTNYTNGHECEELRRCYQSPTVSLPVSAESPTPTDSYKMLCDVLEQTSGGPFL